MKKIAIIGIGGKTGTMFASELKGVVEIIGVGKKKEVKMIKEKKVYIERKGGKLEVFEGKVIQDTQFKEDFQPDFIFLTTKNPVAGPIKFYYQKFKNKEKIPALLISQNGFSPLEDAEKTLKEIFGKNSEKIKIVRIVLFNPIQKEEVKNKILINYSLPIRIALASAFAKASAFGRRSGLRPTKSADKKASGPGETNDLIKIFRKAGFEVEVFPEKEAKNLEFSKLFLNLIGMASASRDISVKTGFLNPEIFREEILALKEYIKVVKASGGKFLNFSHYPVKFRATLLGLLPVNLLLVFRPLFLRIISQERGEKPKELDEIEFYNGAVVKLGKKLGIKMPINEKICKRV